MRISDDRYSRDLQRIDLALRLIGHEARTFTIRQWTGLSDDRIRKLYRNYVMDRDEKAVLRHRGKSPRRVAYFFRTAELQFEATQLAGLYVMHGLLVGAEGGVAPRYRLGSLDSGSLLVQAYEAFLDLHSPAGISFEHAWFLLLALGRQSDISLNRCPACGALELRDPYAGGDAAGCSGCRQATC
jgi:hypothetical protein